MQKRNQNHFDRASKNERKINQGDGLGIKCDKETKEKQEKNILGVIFTEKFSWFLVTKSHKYIKCERQAELSHSYSELAAEVKAASFLYYDNWLAW